MAHGRCGACPGVNCLIPPDGPCQRGGVLFIGEAPGPTEDRQARKDPPGLPFIGKTGDEVNRHYLPLAALRRSEVTFTNAIACLPDRPQGKLDPNREADLTLLETCSHAHLYPLIQRMRPRLVVPLGNFACRAIFGQAFDLELRHDIPCDSPFGPAFPMYHPALGLHEPKKMLYVRTGWDRLRKYLKGSLRIPIDQYPEPDYAEVTDADEILSLDPRECLAGDTEYSKRRGPFCLTYSQNAGTGRLIRADRRDLLDAFQSMLNIWTGEILFHNWVGADWAITEAMGLQFPLQRLVDTMVSVYHLGNLPQGLKALAFRLLGMEMQDFDDLVTPYSREEVIEYYRMAFQEEWPKPEKELVRDEAGHWKLYKPHGLHTKLKTFFTYLQKNPEGKDVFGAWDNWEPMHTAIEEKLGPWPGKDIRHVPIEKTIYYACRDSDALLRLRPMLKRMAALVRKFPQEVWEERAA